jgi:pyruvate dehydrogenase E1 component alpha subunit
MDELIHEPDVDQLQILDKDGNIVDEHREPDLADDELLEMYRYMILGKAADHKFLKLQRQGRFGTFAPCRGQEAAQVGSAYALQDDDWMFPAFRETAVWPVRDLPLSGLIQYWQGDEEGMHIPEQNNDFMISVPVGTQVLHAAGSAWASKKKDEDAATLVYFGDGATSEGDFHEGMNFAGTFQVPCVLLCQNNQYAISVPREHQTNAETLAQKAIAYGFPGIQVDGNDILAMYVATREALERARNGDGPTMIEAYTYRLGDHTTSDDASVYRGEDEEAEWKEKDPIDRFETYLKDRDILNDNRIEEIEIAAQETVDEAVDRAEEQSDPMIADMFEYQFDAMTPRLEDQREHAEEMEGDE